MNKWYTYFCLHQYRLSIIVHPLRFDSDTFRLHNIVSPTNSHRLGNIVTNTIRQIVFSSWKVWNFYTSFSNQLISLQNWTLFSGIATTGWQEFSQMGGCCNITSPIFIVFRRKVEGVEGVLKKRTFFTKFFIVDELKWFY